MLGADGMPPEVLMGCFRGVGRAQHERRSGKKLLQGGPCAGSNAGCSQHAGSSQVGRNEALLTPRSLHLGPA